MFFYTSSKYILQWNVLELVLLFYLTGLSIFRFSENTFLLSCQLRKFCCDLWNQEFCISPVWCTKKLSTLSTLSVNRSTHFYLTWGHSMAWWCTCTAEVQLIWDRFLYMTSNVLTQISWYVLTVSLHKTNWHHGLSLYLMSWCIIGWVNTLACYYIPTEFI